MSRMDWLAAPASLQAGVLAEVGWALIAGAVAIFVLACRWFTRRPRAIVVLPMVAALLWFALLLAFG